MPGLSAMQAAAARVGAPLGHDFCVVSLSDQLKPWEVVERRLDAAGAADLVLALYNPASRTRREQLDARRRGAAAPSRRRDAGRRRARGRRAGGVGLGHDARRRWTSTSSTCARCSSSGPRRRARSRASRRASTPRGATPRERSAQASAASTEASVATSGRGGRRTTITAQPALPRRVELGPRVRPAAVLGDDQVDRVVIDERQLPVERVRAAIEQRSRSGPEAAGRAGRRSGSGTRRRSMPAKEASPWRPVVEQDALALAPDGRGGLVEVVDPVPAVAGDARSSRDARGAGSARRRPARPAPPRRRCAARTGGWRRPRRRRGARRASARAPPGRRSRRCGPRPRADAGWRRARRATRSPPRPRGAGARRARAPRPCRRGSGPRDRP